MISHTAGPWAIVDGHYPCMKEVIGPSFKINIVMSATDLDINDFLKRSADAQLIAAAPDLLEALERLVADVERATHVEFGGTPWLKEKMAEIDYARAAIAKALGEGHP